MSRAHVPPGFVSARLEYPICDDGCILVKYGADDGERRYWIEVLNYDGEGIDTSEFGSTFTVARRKTYRALRRYPETLAEAKRVLGPKSREKV